MSEVNKKHGMPEPGELAALLDGELSDTARAGEISAMLRGNPVLKAEYDEQREMKLLLGGLEEYRAPDFMATRVLAAIEQRRRRQHRVGWVRALAGGLAMFTAGFGVASQLLTGAPARVLATGAERVGVTIPAGLLRQTDDYYSELPALPASFSDSQLDPAAQDYINMLQQAHYDSEVRRMNAAVPNPGTAQAVLVLDTQGGQ